MQIQFISDTCQRSFENKELAVIGISPFNSYFSEERIAYLYRWAIAHFETVRFYLPDGPTVYTLRAIGYDEAKARKKARRQCNYLHNKIRRVLGNQDLESTIVNSSWLANSQTYQERLEFCQSLFDTDEQFKEGCLNSSRWVLSHYVDKETKLDPDALAIAVKYFLSELPLFIWSADILNTGSASFCYHNCPGFLRQLFADRAFDLVDERHGFAVIKPLSLQ